MKQKTLIVILVLGVVLGGLVYVRMRRQDNKPEWVEEEVRQEQKRGGEAQGQQGSEEVKNEQQASEDVEQELNNLSEEIDQVVSDLNENVTEPEVDLNF